MTRKKEYLYEIEFLAQNGRVIRSYIAYRPDRLMPWTVDIDGTEMSPTYRRIGPAQAFLHRHFGRDGIAQRYAEKSILFNRLSVLPCDW